MRLTPHKFSKTSEEYAYELLTSCEDMIHNLWLVELCGVHFVTYHLDTTIKKLW